MYIAIHNLTKAPKPCQCNHFNNKALQQKAYKEKTSNYYNHDKTAP